MALGERGSEQLLGIPPAWVAPEGRVGTARDGLRPADVPSPFPVTNAADRHLMIPAVLPVAAGAWEVRQGIENLSRRVDGLSLEDLAGNDLMRTFVTWTTVP